MALTVTSNTLNGNASPYTGFCIGKPATWIVEFTTTGTFFNKTVYFNPYLFIDKNLPFDDTNILPQTSYSTTLGTTLGKVQGPELPATNKSNVNYFFEFNLISSTVIRCELQFIYTADMGSQMAVTQLNNLSRFQKNAFISPEILVNDITPSVYNQERALRGHFVVGDISTGNVLEQLSADFLTEARWFEEGLAGGAPEFDTWTLALDRAGTPVTKLSAFDDVTVTVTADSTVGAPDADAQIIIYRENNVSNQIDYIQDLELGLTFNDILIEGIDYVKSFVGWSLVAGTTYEYKFTIDKDKIKSGGVYRIIVIIENTGNTIANSYQSLGISADEAPVATTGTMTGIMSDFNFIYTDKNCLQVAPYERIKACVEVDKASYDAELLTKLLPGDFDSNLFTYSVRIYDALGSAGTILELNDKQDDPQLTIIDTFSTYQACVEFRIPPELAQVAFAIDHIFTYRIPLTDFPYDDVVTFRQLVNSRLLDEDTAVTDELLIRMDLFDGASNPVTEICEDFVGPLRVEIEKNATVPDYNLIAMIVKDIEGLTPSEQEDYTNNILEQLDTSEIIAVDVLFGVDNIADFTIEEALLEKGQKYKVIAVAKEENPSPPVSCPIINFAATSEVLSAVTVVGDLVVTFDMDFIVSNFAPSTVATVDINTTTNPSGQGPNQNNVFVAATGTYLYLATWFGGFNNNPIDLVQDVTVTLVNGCTYNFTINHTVVPIVGRITNENEDVNAN